MMFSDKAHTKLKKQNKISDMYINFLLPCESDIGPKIIGPTANPSKKIVIESWAFLSDVARYEAIRGNEGNVASIANGAIIVIAAIVGIKNFGNFVVKKFKYYNSK